MLLWTPKRGWEYPTNAPSESASGAAHGCGQTTALAAGSDESSEGRRVRPVRPSGAARAVGPKLLQSNMNWVHELVNEWDGVV